MEPSDKEPPAHTITFPGRLESLAKIGEFVTSAAWYAGLSPAAVYAVQMAVDEACANIIEHGRCAEELSDIHCSWQSSEAGLTIILADHGCAFDPEAIPPPEINARLDRRKEGGLGLYLIRQLMDEVHFDFKTDIETPSPGDHLHNRLILFKRRTSEPCQTSR